MILKCKWCTVATGHKNASFHSFYGKKVLSCNAFCVIKFHHNTKKLLERKCHRK